MEHPARPGDRLEYRSTDAHNADQLEWVERRRDWSRSLHVHDENKYDKFTAKTANYVRSIARSSANLSGTYRHSYRGRAEQLYWVRYIVGRDLHCLSDRWTLPRSAHIFGSRSIICRSLTNLSGTCPHSCGAHVTSCRTTRGGLVGELGPSGCRHHTLTSRPTVHVR